MKFALTTLSALALFSAAAQAAPTPEKNAYVVVGTTERPSYVPQRSGFAQDAGLKKVGLSFNEKAALGLGVITAASAIAYKTSPEVRGNVNRAASRLWNGAKWVGSSTKETFWKSTAATAAKLESEIAKHQTKLDAANNELVAAEEELRKLKEAAEQRESENAADPSNEGDAKEAVDDATKKSIEAAQANVDSLKNKSTKLEKSLQNIRKRLDDVRVKSTNNAEAAKVQKQNAAENLNN